MILNIYILFTNKKITNHKGENTFFFAMLSRYYISVTSVLSFKPRWESFHIIQLFTTNYSFENLNLPPLCIYCITLGNDELSGSYLIKQLIVLDVGFKIYFKRFAKQERVFLGGCFIVLCSHRLNVSVMFV